MPIFEYTCSSCGEEFETLVRVPRLRPSVRRATVPNCRKSCPRLLPSRVPRVPARSCRGRARVAGIPTAPARAS